MLDRSRRLALCDFLALASFSLRALPPVALAGEVRTPVQPVRHTIRIAPE